MDAGTRSALFREVNDRIYDLTEREGWEGWDGESEFLCECGDDCGSRIALAPLAFAAIRRRGGTVLAAGCVGRSLAAVG